MVFTSGGGACEVAAHPSGTTPDGAAFDDEGSYLVVWTNQGGEWLVTHDIFNSDRPAEDAGGEAM